MGPRLPAHAQVEGPHPLLSTLKRYSRRLSAARYRRLSPVRDTYRSYLKLTNYL